MHARSTKTVRANGLQFTYDEQGEGPLVLCIHGFPDTRHTWHATMDVLAQAGFRAVAPNTRGYLPTELPASRSFSMLDLGQDVLSLIDALGDGGPTLVVGHDWGAMAGYIAANLAPDKIRKLVTLAIPHPRAIKPSLSGIWNARHFITFQWKGWIRRKLAKNNFAYLDEIYRRWSPRWNFPPDELTEVKASFGQPDGIEGPLGYYWQMPKDTRNRKVQKVMRSKTSVPTLCVVGDADGALSTELMKDSHKAFTGPYEAKILPDVGHFLHREDPQAFHEVLLPFLQEEAS